MVHSNSAHRPRSPSYLDFLVRLGEAALQLERFCKRTHARACTCVHGRGRVVVLCLSEARGEGDGVGCV